MKAKNRLATEAESTSQTLRLMLKQVVKVLENKDSARRAQAQQAFHTLLLPQVQERVLEMLLDRALESKVEARRCAAADALVGLGLPALLPLSVRFDRSRKASRRVRLVELAGDISRAYGLPPGYVLGHALHDPDPDVRQAARDAWRALQGAIPVPVHGEASQDRDPGAISPPPAPGPA